MSINIVAISGNLTRDSELRQTSTGLEVLVFSVAVNERTRTPSGDWTDKANYIDCRLFGKRAGLLASKLVKGAKVALCGKLRYEQWESAGSKKSRVVVLVDSLDSQTSSKVPDAVTPEPQSLYDADVSF